jgi:hypothetical protein
MSAESPTSNEDFYAWTQHQAALPGMEKWPELDCVTLAEELENRGNGYSSMGTS